MPTSSEATTPRALAVPPRATTVPDFDIEVFYDGDCPLCMREIRMLQRKDRGKRIRFVDISAPDFDAASVGFSFEAMMDRIRGRLPDGTLIEGVEVFRRLYAAVGFGKLVTLSRLPGVAELLDAGYHVFAKNRLRLTGRCVDGVCEVPDRARPGSLPKTQGRPSGPWQRG